MTLGVTTENWIDSLSLKEQDEYLKLVDAIVVVCDHPCEIQPPYYFVEGKYQKVRDLLHTLACCKAYPQKTLFSANFSLVEIKEGDTPSKLKGEWVNELRKRCLV